MTAKIIQFVPRPNPNRDALDRINGVPANVSVHGTIVAGGPVDFAAIEAEITLALWNADAGTVGLNPFYPVKDPA